MRGGLAGLIVYAVAATAVVITLVLLNGVAYPRAASVPNTADETLYEPGCNRIYAGCVPNVPYDLDCVDITYVTVDVVGYDEYGLDRNGHGLRCE